jgi:hypothetical protein
MLQTDSPLFIQFINSTRQLTRVQRKLTINNKEAQDSESYCSVMRNHHRPLVTIPRTAPRHEAGGNQN